MTETSTLRADPAPSSTNDTKTGLRVVLPIRTQSESNTREHWATKAKRTRSHRNVATLKLRKLANGLPPLLTVRLTRVSPRELDDDNLRSALKATRDGVADALWVDDRTPLVRWEYAQRRGAVGEYAVEVEVSQ